MSVDNLISRRDVQSPKAYLGKGMAWPPLENPGTGDFQRAEAEESVSDCVRHLICTWIGEYPVLRDFGSRVEELLFSTGTRAAMEAVASSVRDGLVKYEKRVDLVNVTPRIETNDKGTMTAFLEVRYRIRATGRVETNVIPVEVEEATTP
jgi:phage baseplate assembly protein W